MVNDLMLLSGVDIPFLEAQIITHQPSIKEIGMIGEDVFYAGCGILNFSKESLSQEDRINLENRTNFEVLMSMMLGNHPTIYKNRINAIMVLTLMFPEYQITFTQQAIILKKEDEIHSINSENFERFKEILSAMFCLNGRGDEETNFNPGGKKAQEIAEKLRKRKQVLAEQKGDQKVSILHRFASILAVGQRQNLNEILGYTVYQLFDQYDRFELKEMNDMHFRAQLAGARDLQEVDNWRKEIHP